MSRTAFIRRFSVLTGKPPITYLTGWRLACAARSLRETTMPLAAIAHQIGYSAELPVASRSLRRCAPGGMCVEMLPAHGSGRRGAVEATPPPAGSIKRELSRYDPAPDTSR
jgi:hypothetical protein